jgi:hypothetical protein
MPVLNKVNPKVKTAATTAATSFFLANPIWSVLLVGVGMGIYWGLRSRRAQY